MNKAEIIRVALYLRVSTEEQALHGYSLAAQEDALIKYANEQGYKIVGLYRDEGFSARKPVLKRMVMQELLSDVEAGRIDMILFTKLDRWFRSVGEYHKVQDVLDRHNVVWKAILEDYQTETADGRLKVNIMLSVAENEADRTSERIKFVFASKRQNKEVCFGGPVNPFGYKIERIDGIRRLVKNPETQEVTDDFFSYIRKYDSVRKAGIYCNEKYGLVRNYRTWAGMARNELYSGTYMGVADFCPAYISREESDRLRKRDRIIKSPPNPDRIYLFTGLIRCPCCGNTLKATFKTYPNDRSKEYAGYRCNNSRTGICEYRHQLSERKLEKYLLQNIRAELETFITDSEVNSIAAKRRPFAVDLKKLNERLRRINVVYMAGNMSDDEYTRETAGIKEKIRDAERQDRDTRPPNLTVLRSFLESDFESVYDTLSKEDRRRVWRSIISEIYVDGTTITHIKFNV